MILDKTVRPYFIKILNSKEEMIDIDQNVENFRPQLELFKIETEFDIDDVVGHDIDDFNSIVICSNTDAVNIKKFAEIIGYKYKIRECSDDLFYNKIDISKSNDTFQKLIEQYIINSFDIDNVLDKKLAGIELTNIDLKILKNF